MQNRSPTLPSFLRSILPAALAVPLLGASLGCSVLSAVANPKAGWALQESSGMSVVVRRAEVAEETARQIDRLLSQTRVNETSRWVPKTAIAASDAKAALEQAGAEASYAGPAPVRIVPAEAWASKLGAICSDESKFPSLLAAVSPQVAEQYADIASQTRKVAELKAALDKEDKALDDKATPAGEHDGHAKEKARIQEEIDKTEAAYKPKVATFLETLRTDAGKAPAPLKQGLGVAVVNLRHAVDDARNANAAAMIRYPLSISSLPQDVQEAAKRFAADVIEERTGHRPDPGGLKPDVKLDGTDVKLTLNGIPADKLGALSPTDLVVETTKRTKNYVTRVLTLALFAADTQDQLSFEADVLDAFRAGFAPDESKAANLSDLQVKSTPKPPGATAPAGGGPKSGNGPRTAACGRAAPDKRGAGARQAQAPAGGGGKTAGASSAKAGAGAVASKKVGSGASGGKAGGRASGDAGADDPTPNVPATYTAGPSGAAGGAR